MVSILKLIRTAKQKAKCPFITQKVTNQSKVFAIATKTMRILVWWLVVVHILYSIYTLLPYLFH